MCRVDELAGGEVKTWNDDKGFTKADNNRPPFKTLVALRQIIAESVGKGVNTKTVQSEYFKLVNELGAELAVLMNVSIDDIAKVSGERTAEGIARVRKGDIIIEPGYDGLYGTVKVWSDHLEESAIAEQVQMSMKL